MQRRHFLAASGLAFAGSLLHAEDHAGHHHSNAFEGCAKTCANCMTECESCFAHCAGRASDGSKPHTLTLQACNDCADLCRISATLAARGSKHAVAVCLACAEACDACVATCGQFKDDAHMQQCAESCRKCASECREMAKHAHHS
jgi:hypothetical protein